MNKHKNAFSASCASVYGQVLRILCAKDEYTVHAMLWTIITERARLMLSRDMIQARIVARVVRWVRLSGC